MTTYLSLISPKKLPCATIIVVLPKEDPGKSGRRLKRRREEEIVGGKDIPRVTANNT